MNPMKNVKTQTVSVSGTSAATTDAFGDSTTTIRVVSTTDCYLKFGAAPVATSSNMLLPANVVEYFAATPGVKLAAIQKTVSGTLYVTEMTK